MKTFEEIKKEVSAYTKTCFTTSSWKCYGAGEIGCEVSFVNPLTGVEEYAYELSGDNGSNTFYNPSGEAWTEDQDAGKEDKITSDFCSNLSADQVLKIYTNIVMTKVNGSSQYI